MAGLVSPIRVSLRATDKDVDGRANPRVKSGDMAQP
jgi:hypothetical protein